MATSLGFGKKTIHYNLKYRDIASLSLSLSLSHKPQASLLGLKGPVTEDPFGPEIIEHTISPYKVEVCYINLVGLGHSPFSINILGIFPKYLQLP